jgi:hypothetical protein
MKNYRKLDSVAVALLAAGCLMIPTALKAVGTPDSADITKLLAEAKAEAVQLKIGSAQLDAFWGSKISWQSYARKLETIRGNINNAGQLLVKLKAAESTGSPWQQTTIKQVETLLREMADNLTATIKHLKDNPQKVHFPEFTDYVKSNYALAVDLEALLRASVEYGTDKAKFERLSSE